MNLSITIIFPIKSFFFKYLRVIFEYELLLFANTLKIVLRMRSSIRILLKNNYFYLE